MQQAKLSKNDFQKLFGILGKDGYSVIAPTVRDNAIIYDEIESAQELPVGKRDEQQAGRYRLKDRDDQAFFGYVVGPHSWKKYLHPPKIRLWSAHRNGTGLKIEPEEPYAAKRAFIGVRPCELQAILVQDKVFLGAEFIDQQYRSRRENLFIVAVNCTEPGGTCFCASMQTGPQADKGFDLALTEVVDGESHYFVVEVGTEAGQKILKMLPHEKVGEAEREVVAQLMTQAEQRMGSSINTEDLQKTLSENQEHPHWQDVAQRCLSCTNCTMVCPTCFCTSVEDVTDLTGNTAERWRMWDSCFSGDFSYVHGGAVRSSTKSRYRQWLTHKFSSWIDQFGTSGCVGCGRCVTWCPVGIDVTKEVAAIQNNPLIKK